MSGLLTEWNGLGPALEDALGEGTPDQLIFDTVTHEHDLRGGGSTAPQGARVGEAVEVALGFATMGLRQSLAANGLPAVLVRFDTGERRVGPGDPGRDRDRLVVRPAAVVQRPTHRRPDRPARLGWSRPVTLAARLRLRTVPPSGRTGRLIPYGGSVVKRFVG